jgi:hydrogenase nickel incorporation protein HypB
MFRAADLMLITKADLLGVIEEFAPERATRAFRELANPAPVLKLSAKSGAGFHGWLSWLRSEVAAHRTRVAAGETAHPKVQPEGAALHGHAQEHSHTHKHAHEHSHTHEHTHADGTRHAHPHTHLHTHAHGSGGDPDHEHPAGHAPEDDHDHAHGG